MFKETHNATSVGLCLNRGWYICTHGWVDIPARLGWYICSGDYVFPQLRPSDYFFKQNMQNVHYNSNSNSHHFQGKNLVTMETVKFCRTWIWRLRLSHNYTHLTGRGACGLCWAAYYLLVYLWPWKWWNEFGGCHIATITCRDLRSWNHVDCTVGQIQPPLDCNDGQMTI